MSHYLKSDELLWPTNPGDFDVRESLPVGTYTVGQHPQKGWYLKPITDFNITGKLYGKTERHAERILNTFRDRPNSTGVLLNGEKGSGKTMLAKLISQNAAKEGISTLVINTPYCGDSFNTFIQEIDEPCMIVFDEFEKVFDHEQQEATLTLLDGVYPTKKLFVLTVNDKYRVNTHMRNRPGRIFYMIEYKGLDAQFIEEYCNDNLNAKHHIPQILRIATVFESFNFDVLKALVEEMNRYGEPPMEAMEILNAKPDDDSATKHTVAVYVDRTLINMEGVYPKYYQGNPITMDELDLRIDEDYENNDSESYCVEIGQNHLKKIDTTAGTYTYSTEYKSKTITIVLTREKGVKRSWVDAF